MITIDHAREREGIWWREEVKLSPDETVAERLLAKPKVILSPDATYDERYVASRWPELLFSPGVTKLLRPRSKRTSRVDLFENPLAFLEFAQTPQTEEGIKAFANRYGPLGQTGFWSYALYAWVATIREMHKAVQFWENSKTTGDFTKLIRFFERLSFEDEEVGEDLAGVPVHLRLTKDFLGKSAILCIRPTHLHRALWAQFVLAIDGKLNLGSCCECGSWFTLEGGSARSDKLYCSDACRMRAYRKRKSDTRTHTGRRKGGRPA